MRAVISKMLGAWKFCLPEQLGLKGLSSHHLIYPLTMRVVGQKGEKKIVVKNNQVDMGM